MSELSKTFNRFSAQPTLGGFEVVDTVTGKPTSPVFETRHQANGAAFKRNQEVVRILSSKTRKLRTFERGVSVPL